MMHSNNLAETVQPYPGLELLSDSKGLYGLAIEDLSYFIRPDVVRKHGFGKIGRPGLSLVCKNHHFCGDEYLLYSRLFENKLKKHELIHPDDPDVLCDLDWWSDDPKEKAKNRQLYFGLKKGAFRITNNLISQVLATIPEYWLKTVRRYPISYRASLYSKLCEHGERLVQMANTFPALVMDAIWRAENSNLDGINMILAGKELKAIAKALDIPMAYRKLKPGVMRNGLTDQHNSPVPPALLNELMNAYLPATTHGQRVWLRVVSGVRNYPTDIIRWFGKYALWMGKTKQEADSLATDLADYIESSMRAEMTDDDMRRIALLMVGGVSVPKKSGDKFITRPFNSKMAFNTVMRLSGEWHEAVADGMEGNENIQFPEPWFPVDHEGGLEFIPITEYVDLFREGKKMRHCVATYADNITSGHSYIYSARVDGERMHTVELVMTDKRISLGSGTWEMQCGT